MKRIIEYLNTGETIAFVGAGVSRELGIPAWPELCSRLVERLDPKLRQNDELKALLNRHRHAEVCGWIQRNVDDEFLYSACREILKDTMKEGRVSSFIAKFPFKAVLTTNFDDSLRRHFEANSRAVQVYGNSREDLEAVDVDTIPSIIKLHSDLDHTDTIILTDTQYSRAKASADFSYLRDWIKSFFLNRRILIVGYSINDPDIQLLFEEVAQNLRRKTPIYAIVADAPPDERARIKAQYNIEIVTYKNVSGKHEELGSLFQALSAFLGEKPEPRDDVSLDLKRAQSLYLWSRFNLSSSTSVYVDSLKSVVLWLLASSTNSVDGLGNEVDSLVGLSKEVVTPLLPSVLRSLGEAGYIRNVEDLVSLTPSGETLVKAASRQQEKLEQSFREQTLLDLAESWTDTDETTRNQAVELVLKALVEVFDQRGVELANAVLTGAEQAGRRSANLFASLSAVGEELNDDRLKYRFVSYMADVLTNPSEAQWAYIEHLALAFFNLHALAMDPDGQRFRQEYLSGRSILVDSNVLIPFFPERATFSADLRELIHLAREAGMPLLTTHGFIEELYVHGLWAGTLVKECGGTSIEVLEAARGEGYRRNTFLDGYVQYSVDVKHTTFDGYLRACVGGKDFSRDAIRAKLEETWGIRCVDFSEVAAKRQEAFLDRDETEEFIRGQAEERLVDKSDSRIRAEAEAYSLVANWDVMQEDTDASARPAGNGRHWDMGVLSQGAYLNRIARYGPRPLGRLIVVPPDALYGFLIRTGASPSSTLSFRELLVSNLFDTSVHFLNRDRYRKYFATLINDSERIFREHLETFQAQLDSSLQPEFLDDVEPLDRPYFLRSLQAQLERLEDTAAVQDAAAAEVERTKRDAAAAIQKSQQEKIEADRAKKRLEKKLRNVEGALDRKSRKKAARLRRRRK